MEKNRASPPQRRISSNPFCKIVLAGRLCTMQTRASPFALCSTFAIFDCIEDRMRFGNGNQTSLLPLLSPFAIFGCRRRQDASRPCKTEQAPFAWLSTFAIFDCIEDRMRLGHAKPSKLLLHGSHLSLSLAVAEDRMRLGHAKPSKLLLHGSRLSLSLRPVAGPDTRPPGIETACQRPPKPRPCPRT